MFLAVLVLCFTPLTTHAAAPASDSPTLLRAGNEAFRAGKYRLAVSKYLQAQKQGTHSALLDFNLGVTYYRLEDYAAADRAFRAAARDSAFTARAWYNLGLVHWARDDPHTARIWFSWVLRSSTNARLRSLAARALAEVDQGLKQPRARHARSPAVKTGRVIVAAARWGHDDNVYRTPDAPYVDLSQPGQPLITPVPQSGEFAEVDLLAQNSFYGRGGTLYRFAYDFDGIFYIDSPLSNADEQSHRLSYSARTPFGRRGDGNLRTLAYLGAHEEINFDPDDGLDRSVAAENIADRFSYLNAVLSGDYTHGFGPVSAGVRARAEIREYGSVDAVSQYDNNYYLLGAHLEFPILARTELRLAYDYSMRDYRDRRSRAQDGMLLSSNPLLEYRYQTLSAALQFDLGRNAWMRLGYAAVRRDDVFTGYDDYLRHTFSLDGDWQMFSRLRLFVAADYRSYDYANAFAFDTPQGGGLTRDDLSASLSAQVRLVSHLLLWGECNYRDVDSTDPRMKYSRVQVPVGLKWEQRF